MKRRIPVAPIKTDPVQTVETSNSVELGLPADDE